MMTIIHRTMDIFNFFFLKVVEAFSRNVEKIIAINEESKVLFSCDEVKGLAEVLL